jgi:hypothetical protein
MNKLFGKVNKPNKLFSKVGQGNKLFGKVIYNNQGGIIGNNPNNDKPKYNNLEKNKKY